MLSGNLATRPFYNERLVRVGLITAVAAAVAWALVNIVTLFSLSQRATLFRDAINSETAKATAARSEAQALRAKLDNAQVAAMSKAAAEANQLIALRGFSWTALFDRLEATLPNDVRLMNIEPQVDDKGKMLVALVVVSRTVEDLDTFIERLEATGAFSGVLSRLDEVLDDSTIQSQLQGYYQETTEKPPSSEPPATALSARAPESSR